MGAGHAVVALGAPERRPVSRLQDDGRRAGDRRRDGRTVGRAVGHVFVLDRRDPAPVRRLLELARQAVPADERAVAEGEHYGGQQPRPLHGPRQRARHQQPASRRREQPRHACHHQREADGLGADQVDDAAHKGRDDRQEQPIFPGQPAEEEPPAEEQQRPEADGPHHHHELHEVVQKLELIDVEPRHDEQHRPHERRDDDGRPDAGPTRCGGGHGRRGRRCLRRTFRDRRIAHGKSRRMGATCTTRTGNAKTMPAPQGLSTRPRSRLLPGRTICHYAEQERVATNVADLLTPAILDSGTRSPRSTPVRRSFGGSDESGACSERSLLRCKVLF